MLLIDKPMPESCDRCPMNYDWIDCRALPNDSDISLSAESNTEIRQKWCPLKEMKPVPAEVEGGGSSWWWVCGDCHGAIDNKDKYCRHCGTEIKWK